MLDHDAPLAPVPDVADQQRPAHPEPADDEEPFESAADAVEADPTDVAEQHRDAPVLDDSEPWP